MEECFLLAFHHDLLGLLSYTIQDHLPKGGTAQGELRPSTSIIKPYKLAYGPVWWSISPIKNPYSQLYLGLSWQKPAGPEGFVVLTLVLGNKALQEMDVTSSNGNKCMMQFTCISTDKEVERNVCAQIAFFPFFFSLFMYPAHSPLGGTTDI